MILLGVDAGVTKTAAAVCDEDGRVLGAAWGDGGSVEGPGGIEAGVGAIARVVDAALTEAALDRGAVTMAAYGIAGADGPGDVADIARGLAQASLPDAGPVVNDHLVAFLGGADRPWGVVSSAGTGAVTGGRGPDGRVVQVGGTGFLHGDFSGGETLGQLAVRAVLMAEQLAAPPTRLRRAVAAHLGLGEAQALLGDDEGQRVWPGRFSPLAPAVVEAANAGDGPAQEILLAVGRNMGRMVSAAIRQLVLEDRDVEVVLAGGTYRGPSPLMADMVALEVHRTAPRAWLHRARLQPVAGAVVLAAEAAGLTPDTTFRARMGERLREPDAGRAWPPTWTG